MYTCQAIFKMFIYVLYINENCHWNNLSIYQEKDLRVMAYETTL